MLIDNSLILDNAFTLTTSGSSTNYIDTIGASGGQAQISGINSIQGGGDAYESLWFEAVIAKAMTAGGISLDVQLWSSNVVASIWTTGNAGSAPTVGSTGNTVKLTGSGAILAASLTGPTTALPNTPGAVLVKQRLPVGVQRYISAFYVTVGTFSGGGQVSAFLIPDVDINLT